MYVPVASVGVMSSFISELSQGVSLCGTLCKMDGWMVFETATAKVVLHL